MAAAVSRGPALHNVTRSQDQPETHGLHHWWSSMDGGKVKDRVA